MVAITAKGMKIPDGQRAAWRFSAGVLFCVAVLLAALDARPLLDLGMRLGEGSGAAASVPLIRLACALHNNMATFEEAGVEDKG